ncbi:MAG: hypothetical protein RJA70_1879 [Pseudomonadota bacterium]|jgi:uncharacterized protein with NAD-binding domain and iron-sulfur cluster
MHSRRRIAIVGGGLGGLVTAFELTSTPRWQQRFDVTVYQSGWLLGGKGASVRNRARHDRIEEHGLHVWMGWYDNAFDVMRRTYSELNRKPGQPLQSWDEAFVPQDFVVLEEATAEGWAHWRFELPRTQGLPGGYPHEASPPSQWITRMLAWLEQVFVNWSRQEERDYVARRVHTRELVKDLTSIKHAWDLIASAAALSLQRMVRALPPEAARPRDTDALASRLSRLVSNAAKQLLPSLTTDVNTRWLWFAIDFGVANIVGLLRDGLVGETDFQRLDNEDYRAWLRRHGATEQTTQAPPVRSIYTLMFSHADGVSASVAVPVMLRMVLSYERAAFFKMAAGMGETVFSPLYEVLRARGVKFEFFHQLTRVGLSEDGHDVAELDFTRQATVKNGGEYQPLFDSGGLPCWPEAPLYEQLVEGDGLAQHREGWAYPGGPGVATRRLHVGEDFDQVVLAVPPPALFDVCAELRAADDRWEQMLRGLRSISTQALQLWMKPDLKALGWQMPGPILGTYEPPYDTWCDMTHLLAVERWSHEPGAPKAPHSLGYFCGQIGSAEDPVSTTPEQGSAATASAKRDALSWLDSHAAWLFPLAVTSDGRFDWSLAYGQGDREANIGEQYFRANTAPSDRYMLSVPGTGKLRMAAHESGFRNLALAGDWTDTGLNGGCVEATTMSGRQAARAIDRIARVIPGEPARYAESFSPTPRAPAFVDRGFDLNFAPPFQTHGCRMHSFFLRADRKALRQLCDRLLNDPCGGAVRYVPAAPLVILAAAFTDHMAAASGAGGMAEVDVAFWVPVLASGGARRKRELCWLLPYVFVDSSAAAALGREVYGFPKVVADINKTVDDLGLHSLSLRALTIREPQQERPVATMDDVLRVRRSDQSPEGGIRGLERILATGQRALDLGLLKPLMNRLGPQANIVFLKQFRDVRDPSRACYQAIVEAPAQVTAYRGTNWSKLGYELKLSDAASMPIASELGLGGLNVKALASCAVDFDFAMELGTEVWRAPT